jgi:hypothetical protein
MNRARDQFLACSGFAENQHGGVGGRNRLDLAQNSSECRTLAHDLIEIELGPNFVFEVKLFFGELILELPDLLKGQRILDGDRHLNRNLNHQFNVGFCECIDSAAGQSHRSYRALTGDQRQRDARAKTSSESFFETSAG